MVAVIPTIHTDAVVAKNILLCAVNDELSEQCNARESEASRHFDPHIRQIFSESQNLKLSVQPTPAHRQQQKIKNEMSSNRASNTNITLSSSRS